ncbi:hypothetical protein BC833DRAFT_620980 [Globomyces pollinis-pini]|nr:hypothetical protein BC833DRAFT_620980 [Globomyces pollinis-pini]
METKAQPILSEKVDNTKDLYMQLVQKKMESLIAKNDYASKLSDKLALLNEDSKSTLNHYSTEDTISTPLFQSHLQDDLLGFDPSLLDDNLKDKLNHLKVQHQELSYLQDQLNNLKEIKEKMKEKQLLLLNLKNQAEKLPLQSALKEIPTVAKSADRYSEHKSVSFSIEDQKESLQSLFQSVKELEPISDLEDNQIDIQTLLDNMNDQLNKLEIDQSTPQIPCAVEEPNVTDIFNNTNNLETDAGELNSDGEDSYAAGLKLLKGLKLRLAQLNDEVGAKEEELMNEGDPQKEDHSYQHTNNGYVRLNSSPELPDQQVDDVIVEELDVTIENVNVQRPSFFTAEQQSSAKTLTEEDFDGSEEFRDQQLDTELLVAIEAMSQQLASREASRRERDIQTQESVEHSDSENRAELIDQLMSRLFEASIERLDEKVENDETPERVTNSSEVNENLNQVDNLVAENSFQDQELPETTTDPKLNLSDVYANHEQQINTTLSQVNHSITELKGQIANFEKCRENVTDRDDELFFNRTLIKLNAQLTELEDIQTNVTLHQIEVDQQRQEQLALEALEKRLTTLQNNEVEESTAEAIETPEQKELKKTIDTVDYAISQISQQVETVREAEHLITTEQERECYETVLKKLTEQLLELCEYKDKLDSFKGLVNGNDIKDNSGEEDVEKESLLEDVGTFSELEKEALEEQLSDIGSLSELSEESLEAQEENNDCDEQKESVIDPTPPPNLETKGNNSQNSMGEKNENNLNINSTSAYIPLYSMQTTLESTIHNDLLKIRGKLSSPSVTSVSMSQGTDRSRTKKSPKLKKYSKIFTDNRLFHKHKDEIYQSAASVIAAYESQPHFILSVFKKLKTLSENEYSRQQLQFLLDELIQEQQEDEFEEGSDDEVDGSIINDFDLSRSNIHISNQTYIASIVVSGEFKVYDEKVVQNLKLHVNSIIYNHLITNQNYNPDVALPMIESFTKVLEKVLIGYVGRVIEDSWMKLVDDLNKFFDHIFGWDDQSSVLQSLDLGTCQRQAVA